MKVNGIIAEYNPFHNGHRYQLEESLRLTGAAYTVVAMSGNFVQRGAPALLDKRARAEMALRCGADLVLELPALYATASAEYFAAGAVALFDRLGAVTHLCFGSECGDTKELSKAAEILLEEPEAYRTALRRFLKAGLSYPNARARGMDAYAALSDTVQPPSTTKTTPGVWAKLLSSPNNILAIDYIKALLQRRSSIVPVTVKRAGSGHHDCLYPLPPATDPREWGASLHGQNNCPEGSLPPASAKSIRQALHGGQTPGQLRHCMPEEASRILETYLARHRAMQEDDLSCILYYKLLLDREQGYEKYLDISAGLSRRILKNLNCFTGYKSFCDLLKTKDMTYTRISRGLLHILLGMEKGHMALGKSLDYAPYAKVLGFRKSATPLLHAIKKNSSVPLITKLADAEKKLPEQAGRLLQMDIFANEIYMGAACAGSGRPAPSDFSTPLVIL